MKVTLHIDEPLLARLDAKAADLGISRSRLIRAFCLYQLAHIDITRALGDASKRRTSHDSSTRS